MKVEEKYELYQVVLPAMSLSSLPPLHGPRMIQSEPELSRVEQVELTPGQSQSRNLQIDRLQET
jgi:hypothetical protein